MGIDLKQFSVILVKRPALDVKISANLKSTPSNLGKTQIKSLNSKEQFVSVIGAMDYVVIHRALNLTVHSIHIPNILSYSINVNELIVLCIVLPQTIVAHAVRG